jgi:HemY protein
MIRAIGFLIKVGVLVAIAVWLADQNGRVEIDWGIYKITFPHIGFFLLTAMAMVLLAIFIYSIIQTFVKFPRSFRRYREIKRKDQGYRALTLGLTAVAAGDRKMAAYQSHRARKLLPREEPLPLLLQAQSERMQGKEEEAQVTFTALTHDKDAGFLGVRGLLQAALDAHNYPKALDLARQALKLHPKQAWILKLVYELEIRARNWEEAQVVLYRAEKAKAIPAPHALTDRVSIFLARAQAALQEGYRDRAVKNYQQAYKYSHFFVPAALGLAKFYKQDNQHRHAAAVIEKTWRGNPHPELARVWEGLVPPRNLRKPMARLQWAEKLVTINPGHPESHLFAGRVAMEESLWGEAREHFRKAEAIEPSARLYWMWANLEKRAGSGQRLIQSLQEKADTFPPERCWVCRETGRIYESWSPVAEPHGAFNTIQWTHPHGFSGGYLSDETLGNDVVLELPRGYSANS